MKKRVWLDMRYVKKGLQTDIFSKHLKDTVVLEGDVLIQFGRNIIEEENQLTK
jgi:hypothetical protein